jgi:hypothetical protein
VFTKTEEVRAAFSLAIKDLPGLLSLKSSMGSPFNQPPTDHVIKAEIMMDIVDYYHYQLGLCENFNAFIKEHELAGEEEISPLTFADIIDLI